MSKYRVVEIGITENYSEFKIERKFLWFWINVRVSEQYLCSVAEASKWIKFKELGLDPNRYDYE